VCTPHYNDDASYYYSCRNAGGAVGDPCDFEGKVLCSNDLSAVLLCEDGELVPHTSCGVGQECRGSTNDTIVCGTAGYDQDDPCFFPDEYRTCSADGSHILACVDGTMKLRETCSGPDTCSTAVEGGVTVVSCD
jgi:hypothetical protein